MRIKYNCQLRHLAEHLAHTQCLINSSKCLYYSEFPLGGQGQRVGRKKILWEKRPPDSGSALI